MSSARASPIAAMSAAILIVLATSSIDTTVGVPPRDGLDEIFAHRLDRRFDRFRVANKAFEAKEHGFIELRATPCAIDRQGVIEQVHGFRFGPLREAALIGSIASGVAWIRAIRKVIVESRIAHRSVNASRMQCAVVRRGARSKLLQWHHLQGTTNRQANQPTRRSS